MARQSFNQVLQLRRISGSIIHRTKAASVTFISLRPPLVAEHGYVYGFGTIGDGCHLPLAGMTAHVWSNGSGSFHRLLE